MENNFFNIDEYYQINVFLAWGILLVVSMALTGLIKKILKVISKKVRSYVRNTSSPWDDIFLDLIDGIKHWVLFVWIFFAFSKSLVQNETLHKFIVFAVVFSTTVQISVWGLYIIRNWKINVLDRRIETDPSSSAAIGLFYTSIRAVFITVMILLALSNLNVDITALITGLGVGGIAIALAAQNVLGDLLASLSIVLDKPFVIGDFIVAGNEKGTVSQIGIKTTRLRSLSGEELIMSNKDILESRVQNFKRMQERRVVQKFGVVYSTTLEQLEQIPGWVKSFIESDSMLRFDRCHFAGYGQSSLDFEFVFYVLSDNYNVYMDHQQQVLLDIFKTFQTKGVDFAFPTRTVIIEDASKNHFHSI